MKKKDQTIQMIRGLCIAAVVLIHSGSGADMQFVPGQEWQFWYWIILRQVINFAVGTFFFLSGYLVNQEKVKQAPIQFIRDRLVRLAIPFIVWSCIYSLKTILLDWPNVDWVSVILHFGAGKAAAPFYFILVLLQLNVLTPHFTLCTKHKGMAHPYLVHNASLLGGFGRLLHCKRRAAATV